jgi:hypothetical protein
VLHNHLATAGHIEAAVSRARGNALQNTLARYLARWWEHAESAGAGRNGSDVLGTPGVVWECKTAAQFRPAAWVAQAKMHGRIDIGNCRCTQIPELPPCEHHLDLPVVVYFPPGLGEANTANAMAIVPLHVMMRVLTEAGYTPAHNARKDTPA